MRDPIKKRGSSVGRHDFDYLGARSDIEVRCAQPTELQTLADMACRLVPGVDMTNDALQRYFAFDPESILTFSQNGKLVGAIAFLYLNARGHDALLLDEIRLTRPETEFLALGHEPVSAIYIWACAITGRGISGYGKAAELLRKPRYIDADIFAQPSTKAGLDWLVATGFQQISSFQRDLWCYQRPWNRTPLIETPSYHFVRSIVDARH